MPGHVGHQTGRIGDGGHFHHGLGAVDEFDQHARIHVPPLGLFHVLIRRGIDVQRIVLALARSHDRIAKADDEFDELHAGTGFIARAQRIDHAEPLGLVLEIGADGDIRLDIHHHQMLAMLHGDEADFGPDGRPAGRIDDDVDLVIGTHRLGISGDGGHAAFKCRIKGTP